MFTISLLESKNNEIRRPTIENDVLIATSVKRIKNTFIGLNFETNKKAINVGRWTSRG
jgi:serine acetyltransferase